MGAAGNAAHCEPWNKGKIIGQKAPFKPKDIWALRARLQMERRVRELALFNLGIDRHHGRVRQRGRPVSGGVGCTASRAELHAATGSSANGEETGHG